MSWYDCDSVPSTAVHSHPACSLAATPVSTNTPAPMMPPACARQRLSRVQLHATWMLLCVLHGTLRQARAPGPTDAEHDGVEGPEAFAQLILGAGAVQLLLGVLGLY